MYLLKSFLFLILLFLHYTIYAQIDAREYNALSILYNSLNGENWTNNTGWDFSSFQVDSTWYGLTFEDMHIVGIKLDGNNLVGNMPKEIGNFQFLKSLNLGSNSISGEIPESIGNLNKLTHLDLSGNNLINDLPDGLSNLTKLQTLWLQDNQITGIIPSQMTSLNQLQSLNLSQNIISGNIPMDFSKLTNIQFVDLHDNNLDGSIPPDLHFLPNLRHLILHKNKLSGEIPVSLWQNGNIQSINLSLNNLSGSISTEIANTKNLTILNLSYNNLNGEIPEEVIYLNQLKELNLSSNDFSGKIPGNIVNLSSIEEMNLSFNQFTGALPDDLGNLSLLKSLRLSHNKFSGELPESLTSLDNLEHLFLDDNKFSGKFPLIQGCFQQLHSLLLSNNSFSELGNLISIPLYGDSGEGLWINNNNFDFEDILPNMGFFDQAIQYSPQAILKNEIDTITLNTGDTLRLETLITGNDIFYFWYFDHEWTENDSLRPQYVYYSLLPDNSGGYTFKLKHKNIPLLELESESIIVQVRNHAPEISSQIKDTLGKANKPLFIDLSDVSIDDRDKNDSLSYYLKQTNGSGLPTWLSFDNENLNVSGVPSNDFIGTLELEFIVIDKALSKTSVSFNLTISNLFSLSGNAWINDLPLKYGVAVLFKENKYLDSQFINNGEFFFSDLDSANYAIQVIPHQEEHPGFFPTFYANAMSIDKAQSVNLYGNASSIDIHLKNSPAIQTGDISVSGIINLSLVDNLPSYTINWSGTSAQKQLAVPVILYNSDSIPVNWTLPDENGRYEFTSIPDDEYFIVYQNTMEAISYDSKFQNKNYNETNIINDDFYIFPHLMTTYFSIKRGGKTQDVLRIKIFSICGKLMYSSFMHNNQNELVVYTNDWGNGAYIVCIQNEKNRIIGMHKFIK